jgi:pantoate--beta-alanine ligase
MQVLARRWRRKGYTIALVPTMGALHNGHLSLIKRARRVADKLVVSIFVNPTQFGPREDYSRYPRTFAADKNKCLAGGADVIFCPTPETMYPPAFGTWIEMDELTSKLEGAARPTHLRGVCTVVLKLFNIVTPDVAVFGQKDFQQGVVIKRMAADLNLGVKIIIGATVREPDGLALSSRNAYLTTVQRQTADVLYRTLTWAKEQIIAGKNRPAALVRHMTEVIELDSGFKVEYIEFADPWTLKRQKVIEPQTVVLIAAQLGRTRFIDNIIVK